MENLNINQNFYWFQQNSTNVYRMNLTENYSWMLVENKDNYMSKEMYRVCIIGPDEVLITGINEYFYI